MRVIVSLTTIPSRINSIQRTIDSIQSQSIKPDIICLSVPDKCRRQKKKEYVIPEFISQYKSLKIIKTDYDYGPSMKLLPVLEYERDPESIIITIDDDHVYSKEFVETLLNYSKLYPHSALGFNGWNVKPLIIRNKYEFIDKTLTKPVQADVLEGYRGVLYKKKFFDENIFKYKDFPEMAFKNDDIWISAHLAKNKIERLVIPGVYCKEYELPRSIHKRLFFKRVSRKLAVEFHKRNYW